MSNNFQKKQEVEGLKLNIENEISYNTVPPGFENERKNIAIDFDSVIHKFDRGWYDGTCYGKPISGSLEAIKELSKTFNVIIFTSKALPDRPLVNNKTGKQLVVEWLQKYNIYEYIFEVTYLKPRQNIILMIKQYILKAIGIQLNKIK